MIMAKDKKYIRSMELWITSMEQSIIGRQSVIEQNEMQMQGLKIETSLERKLLKLDKQRLQAAKDEFERYQSN